MDQRTFDEKVKELATKLKTQGVVTSDSQARMMAESILSTERRQAESFAKKQFDPALNPQQRPVEKTPEAVPETPAGPVGSLAGVDESTPISELLAEEPVYSENHDVQVVDTAQMVENPTEPEMQTEPQEIESKAQTESEHEAQNQPEEIEQEAPTKEEKPVDTRPKVDLSEMFNFSKR